MGDVTFVSPEQLMGDPVSGASDVYALGGLACFLLTGKGPFDGRSAVDIAGKHLKAEPPDLSEGTSIPRGLAQLIKRCLAKNPAHRPSADDVARATASGADASADGEENLVEALSKRRFGQIVGAYVVAGLGVLGLVDMSVDREVIDRVWFVLALSEFFVGLSAACVIAWFHGEKGRQEFGRLEVSLLAVLALVAVGVGVIIFL